MMTQPTNLGAITERRIERVMTREGCMELALHQIIMKCDGSEMQTKRIRNIRERAKAGLEGRDPSSPDELAHVPPNRLLMAQLELSGKETDAARAERDALAAELKALREKVREKVRLEAQCQRASGSLPDGWDITISLEKGAGWVDLYRGDEEVELSCDCGNLASHLEAAIDHAIATAGAPS